MAAEAGLQERTRPPPALPEGWRSRRPRPPRQRMLERAAVRLGRAIERSFVVLALFLFSGALLPLLLNQSGATTGNAEGNVVLRVTFAFLHAVSLLLLVIHWRAALAAVARNRATIALVALALVSVAWSAVPEITLRRSVAFLGTSAFGVYLACRHSPGSVLRFLAISFAIAALLSAAFAVGLPHLGVAGGEHAGAWRGIFSQKNNLGQTMALSTAVFLVLAQRGQRRQWLAWGGVALSFALLLMSTSMTALIILVTLVALMPLFRALRWHPKLLIPVLIGCVLVSGSGALWLATKAETLLVSLGRDVTLTGRIPLWRAVLEQVAARPWLGYGYSAFWRGPEGPSGAVLSAVRWRAPHAHNGYIDILAQLGVVGLLTFLVGLGQATTRAVAALRREVAAVDPIRFWPLVFLSFIALYNVTETTILQGNTLYWVLYVWTVCSVLLSRRSRLRCRAGASPAAPPAHIATRP